MKPMRPSERLIRGFTGTFGCAELEFGAMVICRYLADHGDRWVFPVNLDLCRSKYCVDDWERAWFDRAMSHGHTGATPELGVDHKLTDLLCCGILSNKTIEILIG